MDLLLDFFTYDLLSLPGKLLFFHGYKDFIFKLFPHVFPFALPLFQSCQLHLSFNLTYRENITVE